MKADATTRSEIVGKHARSTKFHHPVGGKTTTEYLQDFSRVHSRLRPKHQCLANCLNSQCHHNLIAGFNYLARPILSNMHNRFAQRLKDGQALVECVFVPAAHNGERASNSSLIPATHWCINHGYMIFSQS